MELVERLDRTNKVVVLLIGIGKGIVEANVDLFGYANTEKQFANYMQLGRVRNILATTDFQRLSVNNTSMLSITATFTTEWLSAVMT